ncbi:MAG TPA: N-6 DNA methylase [Candidatus Competibacter sp.]|nr:N-6 DNA methylase [Candidatus Competibacteraceae bacterium]HPE70573.1 N-6 DNA methylase [Candidatus Competibacter sp.]HRX70598.1 N-6 DNA methylase [Candidatus Competibacteraceae bacterium]
MAAETDLRERIEAALAAFSRQPIREAATKFLAALGYRSDRTLNLGTSSPRAFLELVNSHTGSTSFNESKALFSDWASADLLFQFTDEELSGHASLFKDTAVEVGLLRSYLFFGIELTGGDYPRGKLTGIARQINSVFPMPVMVLIKHLTDKKPVLSIAVINRRQNKRDAARDVLGKVTIIRDVSLTQPHRGHLDILASFAVPNLVHPQRLPITNFDTLHAAWEEIFNVELLNQRFYRELANWYFWALPQVEFPADTEKDDDKRRATSLIRLLTRLIFCWFLKEKGLIPEKLFVEAELQRILTDLAPDASTYHQAILQNLFFATLNQRMGKDRNGQPYRAFARDEGFPKNRATYGVDTLYRYEEHFRNPDTALDQFADVPFLNGGLFECLDRIEDGTNKKLYVDGFSRNKKKRPQVPNCLFFGEERTADLSDAYGEPKRRNEKVRGLLRILHSYKFTIIENTPIDQEIALDPELLGKVFENLLASYNEETKTTARKQTGSFYTPRPIVEYMVDESLKAHLMGTLTRAGMSEEDAQAGLDILFAYTERDHAFQEREVAALLDAIHTCKILDPACGSGAFPMGMLHKLVYIIHKLDPQNARWKQLQIDSAATIPDPSARDAAISAIKRDFTDNEHDYGRKLYLIENCLYGVDIQAIAIQISKLRFFISLVCDQRTNRSKKENHGISPLPNLETKFVAADALIGLPEMEQLALVPQRVYKIEAEIESLYHSHFAIQRREQKLAIQRKIKDLRNELGRLLTESLMASKKAQHVADWDPFDPQASADFFDAPWMFGRSLAGGFDIVFGNPPYLNVELVDSDRKANFAKHFRTFYKRYDVFGLFFEAALTRYTGQTGVVSFIIPQQIANNLSYKKLRNLILENRWLREVLYLGDKVFKAANNDVCVLFLTKSANRSIRLVNALDFDERITTTVPPDHFARYENVISFSGDARGESIFEKVFSGDRWLVKERFSVFQGIVTGNNAAFLPTPEQIREAKIEKALLYPVLLGRDFERWAIRSTNRRIIYANSDTEIRKFPNTEKWLNAFRGELKLRRECVNGVIPWFSLQWPRDQDELDRVPKIVVQGTRNPRLANRIVATIDDEGIYGTQGLNFIVPRDKSAPIHFLLGVLNSSLINYLFATKFLNVAIKAEYLKGIPIPKMLKRDEDSLSILVRCILAAKRIGEEAAAQFIEDLIDACVFECYFREHMEERDLLFLNDLAPHLASYDLSGSESKQREFLNHLHRTLNAAASKIRNRLVRLSADSPELLAVIKKGGKA